MFVIFASRCTFSVETLIGLCSWHPKEMEGVSSAGHWAVVGSPPWIYFISWPMLIRFESSSHSTVTGSVKTDTLLPAKKTQICGLTEGKGECNSWFHSPQLWSPQSQTNHSISASWLIMAAKAEKKEGLKQQGHMSTVNGHGTTY